jgi:hypothetical protein
MNSTETAGVKLQYWQPLTDAEKEGGDPLTDAIWQIVTRIYPTAPREDRRETPRYAFPYLVQLQPVLEDGVSRQDRRWSSSANRFPRSGWASITPGRCPVAMES